jgi:hypothetical protein
MEGGDTSDQHLNASDRQIQALTANISGVGSTKCCRPTRNAGTYPAKPGAHSPPFDHEERFKFLISAKTAEKTLEMRKKGIRTKIRMTKEAQPIRTDSPGPVK